MNDALQRRRGLLLDVVQDVEEWAQAPGGNPRARECGTEALRYCGEARQFLSLAERAYAPGVHLESAAGRVSLAMAWMGATKGKLSALIPQARDWLNGQLDEAGKDRGEDELAEVQHHG